MSLLCKYFRQLCKAHLSPSEKQRHARNGARVLSRELVNFAKFLGLETVATRVSLIKAVAHTLSVIFEISVSRKSTGDCRRADSRVVAG